MKIEAVTVCVNYADFLDHSLTANLQHFDDIVVVTKPDDTATLKVCAKHCVRVVKTNVFTERGDTFNKGRAINLGLSHLRHEGWLVHLDADIILPDRFRAMIEKANLQKDCIYGADRVDCKGYDKWIEYRNSFDRQFKWHYLLNSPKGMNLAARVIHDDYGWCPIGFFQLWHPSMKQTYPTNQGSAEHTDLLFSIQWDRAKRILLPEIIFTSLTITPPLVHLESQSETKMGANWNGRKTPPFGKQEDEASRSKNLNYSKK